MKNEEITLLKEEIKEINEEFEVKLRNSEENSDISNKFSRKESMYNYVDLRRKYIEELDQLKDEIEILKKTEGKLRNVERNQGINDENTKIVNEKEREKERRTRISSFFSKNALNKMVQEIQSHQLIRKKSILYSEKAIEDHKKINEDLKAENKRLMELVERVRAETNKNKEFIINNIRELEKRHQSQIEKKSMNSEEKVEFFIVVFSSPL